MATAKHDANVYRSARNIAGVSVSPAGELNALRVLSSRRMLVTKAALDALVASAKAHGRRNQPSEAEARRLVNHATHIPQTTTITLEPHQIILRPLVTEKGMHRSTRNNAYAFEVHRLATKADVRRAVEELFNVKVLKVHTQNRKGKPRRTRFRSGHDRRLEEGDRHAGQRTPD